jgi:hypothetical protein
MARIRMQPLQSTSIAEAGYDEGTHTLRLRYIDGDLYDYRHVPKRVFDQLLAAPSKGQFVNWQIKPYYSYQYIG